MTTKQDDCGCDEAKSEGRELALTKREATIYAAGVAHGRAEAFASVSAWLRQGAQAHEQQASKSAKQVDEALDAIETPTRAGPGARLGRRVAEWLSR